MISEIYPGIEIYDLCLYLKEGKILVIGDTHIGYEEAMNKNGVFVPRHQFKDTMERLRKIVESLEIKKIIFLGDVKHEFGTISETEWRHTLKLLNFLSAYSEEIILLRGNHDTILGPIADKGNIKLVFYYKMKDIFFCHGDKLYESEIKNSKLVIIGHEHPAISLKDNNRVERFKCFLKGRYGDRILIVVPSFNLVTEGTDVINESLLSPFLDAGVDDFEAWLVADKVYYFGKLKDLD